MRLLDLSFFNNKCVTLTPVAAKDRRAVEIEVQSGCEGKRRVCEEANATAAGGIQDFAPCLGTVDSEP